MIGFQPSVGFCMDVEFLVTKCDNDDEDRVHKEISAFMMLMIMVMMMMKRKRMKMM